jgi:hypothetical protein
MPARYATPFRLRRSDRPLQDPDPLATEELVERA